MGGGGGGGASEKMTPYASTMQHSLSSVSDQKKCAVGKISQLQRRQPCPATREGAETSPGDSYITNIFVNSLIYFYMDNLNSFISDMLNITAVNGETISLALFGL